VIVSIATTLLQTRVNVYGRCTPKAIRMGFILPAPPCVITSCLCVSVSSCSVLGGNFAIRQITRNAFQLNIRYDPTGNRTLRVSLSGACSTHGPL